MDESKNKLNDYGIRVHDHPGEIPAADWDALLATQDCPSPFMKHAYLLAMHASGSAMPRTGWRAQFFSLWLGEQLVAACPLYLKTHSYGEYVFDWAWANAYAQHGLDYYPKALIAVPFTPVPGSRLLADNDAHRDMLLQAVVCLGAGKTSCRRCICCLAAKPTCKPRSDWVCCKDKRCSSIGKTMVGRTSKLFCPA